MKGYGKECFLGPLFKLLEATFELFVPLVVAAIVGVCNLTVMGGGGFMLVSAEDRKRFWKYLQNKWRGGNRFEVTK